MKANQLWTQILQQTIQSANTSYVFSDIIDCQGFDLLSISPSVSLVAAGKTANFKIQYSFDKVNWMDVTVDTPGTPAGGEVVVAQNADVRAIDMSSAGIKNGVPVTARAPWLRIAQKSGDVSSLSVTYTVMGK